MRKSALLLVLIVFFSFLAAAQEIAVAAAADLQFAMQDIAARFQKETGKTLKLTYGSSGNFFAQLQNGAPFDVYFSANLDYPKRLEAAGLTEPDSYYEYATGKIVIWVSASSKLDLRSGLAALANQGVGKIAIANPQHAPYGQAAVAALKKENVYDNVSDRLVLGENISQTASLVVSGAADAGIVALSLALAPTMKDKGRYVEVPAGDYPPIKQACVIMRSAKNKDAAREFLEFLKKPAIGQALQSYGFVVPGNSTNVR